MLPDWAALARRYGVDDILVADFVAEVSAVFTATLPVEDYHGKVVHWGRESHSF